MKVIAEHGPAIASTFAPESRSAPGLSIAAIMLLGRWTRLVKRHGGGCSCCVDAPPVKDYEQQILDFLRERHVTDAAFAADLREFAQLDPGKSGSVDALLKRLAQGAGGASAPAWFALLVEFGKCLDTFELY